MTKEVIETAQSISDVGMMAMTAAFFLLLSGGLMVACFKWFKSIIDNMLNDNQTFLLSLHETMDNSHDMIKKLCDMLEPETQLKIKNMSGVFFDYSTERVCRIIKKVREENNISDKEATAKKIYSLLKNIHDDRNSRFDYFSYRGRPLSSYTSKEWIDWVAEVVAQEVYSERQNNGRAYTNVQAVYDKIKLDFYHRMNSK